MPGAGSESQITMMKHAGGGGAASAVGRPSVHNRVREAKSLRTERSEYF